MQEIDSSSEVLETYRAPPASEAELFVNVVDVITALPVIPISIALPS